MSLRKNFTSDPDFVGEQIDNYLLTSLLANSGFSSVYMGTHVIITNRRVVIKVLREQFVHFERGRRQFLQEANLLEKLKHEHILPILDAGIYRGYPYIVTPYMPDGTLMDRLQRDFPLTREEIEVVLSQIGSAIVYMHCMNVIHCDLKPENILYNARNQAVLADFGIAEILTGESLIRPFIQGSYDYMPPEQFKRIVSKKTDQYAFGCIVYQLYTGHLPFQAESFHDLVHMHLYEYPIDPRYYNPAIPAHIAQAILQALAKSSDQRHESVADFLHVLGLTETHIGRRTGLKKNKEQWLMEGYAEYKADHYNYALEAFNFAIRLDPHYADAYYGKGLVLFRQNDYRGALESFDTYIRSNPQSSKAYLRRGNALYCLKQYEEAIKAYNQAIRLNPSYALAFYNKGLAFECLGFRRKAILARKRARQLGFAK